MHFHTCFYYACDDLGAFVIYFWPFHEGSWMNRAPTSPSWKTLFSIRGTAGRRSFYNDYIHTRWCCHNGFNSWSASFIYYTFIDFQDLRPLKLLIHIFVGNFFFNPCKPYCQILLLPATLLCDIIYFPKDLKNVFSKCLLKSIWLMFAASVIRRGFKH